MTARGRCRWRIDRTVGWLVAAGLVQVVALVFAAGWLVGNYGLSVATAEVSQPVGPMRRSSSEVRKIVLESKVSVLARPVEPLWTPPPSPVPWWTVSVRLPRRHVGRPADYSFLIQEAADRHALSADLVTAVARVESRFDPFALSPKGARGLLQVLPDTARRFGLSPDRLYEPETNLAAGTAYLAWLFDRYDGDLDLTLAAYNAGEGAVDQHKGIPPFRETQEYVRRVRAEVGPARAKGE